MCILHTKYIWFCTSHKELCIRGQQILSCWYIQNTRFMLCFHLYVILQSPCFQKVLLHRPDLFCSFWRRNHAIMKLNLKSFVFCTCRRWSSYSAARIESGLKRSRLTSSDRPSPILLSTYLSNTILQALFMFRTKGPKGLDSRKFENNS